MLLRWGSLEIFKQILVKPQSKGFIRPLLFLGLNLAKINYYQTQEQMEKIHLLFNAIPGEIVVSALPYKWS